jgi:hypothetical protein
MGFIRAATACSMTIILQHDDNNGILNSVGRSPDARQCGWRPIVDVPITRLETVGLRTRADQPIKTGNVSGGQKISVQPSVHFWCSTEEIRHTNKGLAMSGGSYNRSFRARATTPASPLLRLNSQSEGPFRLPSAMLSRRPARPFMTLSDTAKPETPSLCRLPWILTQGLWRSGS